MPKYRYLSDEELIHLEDEFKQFLIVNHVYKEEWEKINVENSEKALELVGLFSDQVLQRVYEKITFLEKRTKDACFLFHFGEEKLDLIIIQSKNKNIDLGSIESIHEALKTNFKELDFFKSSRKYTKNREEEIHITLEQGAELSSQDFWDLLTKIIT
ncbi:MAG: DUF6495 family protein [Bacteroidota bacterium]